jgi:hypothetical protein
MTTDALVYINIRQGGVMQGSGAGRAGADVMFIRLSVGEVGLFTNGEDTIAIAIAGFDPAPCFVSPL